MHAEAPLPLFSGVILDLASASQELAAPIMQPSYGPSRLGIYTSPLCVTAHKPTPDGELLFMNNVFRLLVSRIGSHLTSSSLKWSHKHPLLTPYVFGCQALVSPEMGLLHCLRHCGKAVFHDVVQLAPLYALERVHDKLAIDLLLWQCANAPKAGDGSAYIDCGDTALCRSSMEAVRASVAVVTRMTKAVLTGSFQNGAGAIQPPSKLP